VRTPERAAALLVAGTLDRAVWPELDDEEFASDVRRRLGAVGLELVAAAGRWVARSAAEEESGFHPAFRLHSVEMAMVAALYLHLRYLPNQPGADPVPGEPSVGVEDLVTSFPGYNRAYLENQVLGHLRNAGFVRREEGRLYAGPYLAAVDGVEAEERARTVLRRFVLERYLRRRAEEAATGNGEVDHAAD